MSKLTNQKKNDQRPLKALKEKRGNCIEVSLPAFINSSWIHLNAEFKDDHLNTSLSSIFLFLFLFSHRRSHHRFPLLLNALKPPFLPFIYAFVPFMHAPSLISLFRFISLLNLVSISFPFLPITIRIYLFH